MVSRFVSDECRAGDPTAVQERLVYLKGLPLVGITEDAELLVETLISRGPLPMKAAVDAYHISVSAVNGVENLLTWNCKHIANPALRPKIERICRQNGI